MRFIVTLLLFLCFSNISSYCQMPSLRSIQRMPDSSISRSYGIPKANSDICYYRMGMDFKMIRYIVVRQDDLPSYVNNGITYLRGHQISFPDNYAALAYDDKNCYGLLKMVGQPEKVYGVPSSDILDNMRHIHG